jgi:hypothetical protein
VLPARPKRSRARPGDLVRIIWYAEEKWVGKVALIYHAESLKNPSDWGHAIRTETLWLALCQGEPIVLYNREQFSILPETEPPPPLEAP